MELEDLRAYVAVVDHNGFRRAAAALFVSQPSLTRRVARLEQEFKGQLLQRTRNGVHPTPQGEILLSGARRVLATVEETRATTNGSWEQTIVLACTTTAAGSYLTDFLATWIPEHPTTRVRMIEDSPMRTRRRLVDHECDLAIMMPLLPEGAASLPMTHVEVQAVMPPEHPLATPGPVRVQELAGHPLLVVGEQFRSTKLLRAACQLAGVQPEIIFECSAGPTVEALVRAGTGIGVLSEAVSRTRAADVVTRTLCDADGKPLAFDLHIAWIRERLLQPAVHEFARDLSEFTRDQREAS